MKLKNIKCIDPRDPEKIKYRLSPFYSYRVTLDDMAENISRSSSINKADTLAVLDSLSHELVSHVMRGGIVSFDNFGSFRLSVSSAEQDSPELTSVNDVRKKKVLFRLNHSLQKTIDGTKFVKIKDASNETDGSDDTDGE